MKYFLLGIASSLIGAVLFYLLRFSFGGIISLLFSRLFPNISGRWLISDDGARNAYPNQKEEMHLRQFANRLQGSINVFSEDEIKAKFLVSGRIAATRVITLWFESKTPGHHNYGAAVYKLSPDGKTAKGTLISMCVGCEDFVTSEGVTLEKLDDV